MTSRQTRSLRKKTGGRRRPIRKSRKSDKGGPFTATQIGEHDVRARDARGNGHKLGVRAEDTVSLSVDGETEEAEIERIVENPANPDFVRRDILTKGAVVETEKGKARITSRPGQDGTINAVLLDEE